MSDLEAVFKTLSRYRFSISNEADLQMALADTLADSGFQVKREVVLTPANRIDLLVNGHVGIEVKTAGSVKEVTRQLRRYAEHVDELGLVTMKRGHLQIAAIDFGVPFKVCLAGGYL